MKSFILSILVTLGSLFGFPHQSQPVISTSTDTTVINVNTASSTASIQSNTGTSPVISVRTLPVVSKLPFSTTGWKTYQDNQSGIKVEYPSDWYLEHGTLPGLATIQLMKDGYTITIQACGSKCAPGDQTYAQNSDLSSSSAVSLNIDGFQAWRALKPEQDDPQDPRVYFALNFLRDVATSTGQSSFNNTSLYTPVSILININGTFYSVSYQPSDDATTNYDHSLISQMDEIAQTITLSPATGF